MKNDYSVAVIIPAYNDARTIEEVISEAHSTLGSVTSKFQILTLNDGSVDDTAQALERLSKKYNNLKIIHHPKNMGFGRTLRTLFANTDCDVNFMIPGDGQVRAPEILKMWPYLEEYDFILGKRKIRKDNIKRRFSSFVYNLLVSMICSRRITDVNSTVLYKTRVLDGVKLESESALIHAELLIKVVKKGYKVTEIFVQHRPRDSGKAGGGKISTITSTAKELIRNWSYLARYK